jgi:nitric oxide dioxygenase
MLTSLPNDEVSYRSVFAPPSKGWAGWREFELESKQSESEFVTSFTLRPIKGSALPHRPGQHLTLLLGIEGRPALKRSYSISSAPNGESYRISVKREALGIASNWLHGTAGPGTIIPVMAPRGTFVLQAAGSVSRR